MRSRKFFLSLFAIFTFGLLAAVGYAQTSPLPQPVPNKILYYSPSSLKLVWNRVEATRDSRVLGWNIYRNGILRGWVAEGNDQDNRWVDHIDAGDNTPYTYTFTSTDGVNESLPSSPITRVVSTPGATLAAPTLDPTNGVPLVWHRVGPKVYRWNVYRDGILHGDPDDGASADNYWNDWDLPSGDKTRHRYYVVATDGTNPALPSNQIVRDVPAPPTPTGLSATFLTSGQFTTPSVKLNWNPVTGADQYALFSRPQGGVWSLRSTLTDPYATAGQIEAGTMQGVYEFKVQACNAISQICSGDSSIVSVSSTASSTTAGTGGTPASASGVTVSASSIFKSQLTAGETQTANVTLRSDTSLAGLLVDIRIYNSSNVMVGYKSFQNVYISAGGTANFSYDYASPATLLPGTYTVFVGVWNSNWSMIYLTETVQTFSVVAPSIAPDTTSPTAPTLTATAVTPTEINVSWTGATDSAGIAGYTLFRNGAFYIGLIGTSYVDRNVSSDTSYTYTVKAFDFAGNVSSPSPQQTVPATTLPTPTIPSAPTNLRLGSGVTNGISLAWTDNATNEDKWRIERKLSSAATYEFLTYILSANTTAYTDTTAVQGTSYDYRIQACSTAGCSAFATLTGVSFGTAQSATDTTNPTAPTTVTATVLSSSQISVSWSGATDAGGIAGYKIFRNGSYYTGLTGTNYTDTGVSPDTSYSYAVKAVDIAGYESPLSPSSQVVRTPPISITATTTSTTATSTNADITPPNTPYVSYTPAATSITFSFAGAPDAVKYEVFKNGTLLKTVYVPTCTDSGLTPNTPYSYYVVAFDAAGNRSAPTPTLYVRTLALTSTVSATTTTTNTIATTTTTNTTTPSKILVSVMVDPGASFCDGSIAKTKMTFTATPSTGAYFKIVRNNIETMDKKPGTYDLPNGTYSWQAIANSGYTFDHIASDRFVLDKWCEAAVTTTAAPTTAPTTAPPPAVAVTETNTPNLTISSPAVVEPVAAVVTQEQYANYCDDPLHRTECQTYAAEKIITQPTQTGEVTTSVSGGTALNQEAPIVSEEVSHVLAQRLGVRMFQDTDADGITDYDEVNIYYTDPKRSDTNGDGASDGDQLLSGTNPLAEKQGSASISMQIPTATSTRIVSASTSSNAILYENPKLAGEKKPFLLAVKNVESVTKEDPDTSATSTALVLTGTALPNSFVTLYIFSDPIVVRVKADSSGAWVYTLDAELADGTHEVVSAITDTGGRILAKSEAAPFVKTAAAVSFGATELLPTQSAPSFFSGTYFYLLVALLVALLLVAFAVVGMMVKQKNVREGGGGGMASS